jgi:MYXO-CTERM domain-containing protein
MGSLITKRSAGTICACAISLVAMPSQASDTIESIGLHIDIPEIARVPETFEVPWVYERPMRMPRLTGPFMNGLPEGNDFGQPVGTTALIVPSVGAPDLGSTTAVPAPGAVGLVGVAALAGLRRRRR